MCGRPVLCSDYRASNLPEIRCEKERKKKINREE
jgi:hypothetical protein